MPLVTLSLGSNINPSFHIREAVKALRAQFDEVRLSPVYESEAVGFSGDNFLNLVVAMRTAESPGRLAAALKALEDRLGRDRSMPRFSGRTIDIDILTYGDLHGIHEGMELPRPETIRHAFILLPMADLLPDGVHPGLGRTWSELRDEFDAGTQRLWPIDFDWQQ